MCGKSCPVCANPLSIGRAAGQELGACLPCGGTWLRRGMLAALARAGADTVARIGSRLRESGNPSITRPLGARRCPECRVPLESSGLPRYPDVRAECCTVCHGTWISVEALLRLAVHLGWRPPVPAEPPTMPGCTGAGSTAATHRRDGGHGARCPGCGERNDEQSPVCWACGFQLAGALEGRCPSCDGLRRRIAGIRSRFRGGRRAGSSQPVCPDCPDCREFMPGMRTLVSPEPVHTCRRCCAHFIELETAIDLLSETRMRERPAHLPLLR